jgi:hypothetical protein
MELSRCSVLNISACAFVRIACACGSLSTVTSPWKIQPAAWKAAMTWPRKSVRPMTPCVAFVVVSCWTWTHASRPGLVTRSTSRMTKP